MKIVMEKLMKRKIVMMIVVLIVSTLLSNACDKLGQDAKKHLILEGIQVQLPGPASRVMICKSQENEYTYVVTDANMASLRLNGIPVQGYNGIEVSKRLRPEVEIQVRMLKSTEMPVTKGKDGIARFDFHLLVIQGNAEARVISKAKTISVADGAIIWSFMNEPVITLFKGDDGEYYDDFPKLVRDGSATVIGQDGKSVSFDEGTSIITFKGNQEIPVSEDEQGRCYLDFPKLAAEHGGLSVHLKQLQDIKESSNTILRLLLYTEGSEHVILSDIECFGYRFSPDSGYPLVFKMVKDVGYIYLCGRGIVVTVEGTIHRLGYEDTIETLLPLLESHNQLDREGASQALGWLTKTEEARAKAIPALIDALLSDQAMEVRRNAAEALGRINVSESRIIEALNGVVAKEDEHVWVKEVATECLSIITNTTSEK